MAVTSGHHKLMEKTASREHVCNVWKHTKDVVGGSRTSSSGRVPELRSPRMGRNEPGKAAIQKRAASRRDKELFLKILAVWFSVPSLFHP